MCMRDVVFTVDSLSGCCVQEETVCCLNDSMIYMRSARQPSTAHPEQISYKYTKLLTGLIDKSIAPHTCLRMGVPIFRGVIIYRMQLSKEITILKNQ